MSNNTVDYRAHIASELLGCETPQHLESYFRVYDNLLARSDVRVLQIEDPSGFPRAAAPLAHLDVLKAANVLRSDPNLTLKQAIERLATADLPPDSTHSQQQPPRQSRLAILIAVRCMLMLDSAVSSSHGEGPGVRDLWQEEERLVDFVYKSFPRSLGPSNQVIQALKAQKSLKAWKLRARSGITFKGTDNLAQHLLLDPARSTLYLFHHTAFIKAQLSHLHAVGLGKEEDMLTCLRTGSLPSRLLTETLRSLQVILFHFDDHRSSKILERLIRKEGFDEDCAQPGPSPGAYKMFDGSSDSSSSSKFDASSCSPSSYLYWGERLATLHEFVQNRPPRNKFDRWIKWQTSDSNAFLVAITALFISVVIGFLSLGLAVLQTWIAWKAWKDESPRDQQPCECFSR